MGFFCLKNLASQKLLEQKCFQPEGLETPKFAFPFNYSQPNVSSSEDSFVAFRHLAQSFVFLYSNGLLRVCIFMIYDFYVSPNGVASPQGTKSLPFHP